MFAYKRVTEDRIVIKVYALYTYANHILYLHIHIVRAHNTHTSLYVIVYIIYCVVVVVLETNKNWPSKNNSYFNKQLKKRMELCT